MVEYRKSLVKVNQSLSAVNEYGYFFCLQPGCGSPAYPESALHSIPLKSGAATSAIASTPPWKVCLFTFPIKPAFIKGSLDYQPL